MEEALGTVNMDQIVHWELRPDTNGIRICSKGMLWRRQWRNQKGRVMIWETQPEFQTILSSEEKKGLLLLINRMKMHVIEFDGINDHTLDISTENLRPKPLLRERRPKKDF